jgi:hypothetical protein
MTTQPRFSQESRQKIAQINPPFLVSLISPRNICSSPPQGPPISTPFPTSTSKTPTRPLRPASARHHHHHSVRKNKEESSRKSSPPPASPYRLPAIVPPPGRPSGGRVAGFGAGPGPGTPMASPEQEAAVAEAVVEDVMRLQGGGGGGAGGWETVGTRRNIDIAWRKAEEAGEFVSW